MAKFRKKPIVIEAFKWTGGPDQVEDPTWIVAAIAAGIVWFDGKRLGIHTLEGDMKANPGDWIIQGVKGEIYPCKPDVFEATYDLAGEDLGHVEILAREVVTDGGDKRVGMSYLVYLSDQSSEVMAEAWLILGDDGTAEALSAEEKNG